jgi:siroheme synthase-like protein
LFVPASSKVFADHRLLRNRLVFKHNADMSMFPILVKVKGRACLVVGAGTIAASKAEGLLRHGARVRAVSPRATEWIQTQASAGNLLWEKREFVENDVDGAFLVVAATNSTSTNEAVFRACQARAVLCNVVDDPEHCDFFYPAIVERGPLQIAISTGGRSPALARRIRMELERQFGPEYGEWVEHVGKLRKQLLNNHLDKSEEAKTINEMVGADAFEKFIRQRKSRRALRNDDKEADQ